MLSRHSLSLWLHARNALAASSLTASRYSPASTRRSMVVQCSASQGMVLRAKDAAPKKKGKGGKKKPMDIIKEELMQLPEEDRIKALVTDPSIPWPEPHEFPRWLPEVCLIPDKPFSLLTPLDKRYHKLLRRDKIKKQNMLKKAGD